MNTDQEIRSMCWYDQQCVNEVNRFVDLHVKGKEPVEHFLFLKQLLNLCPKGATLLDMGTGSAMVAEHCSRFKFYGCDLPHMIVGCAMRNQPNYFYKTCDIIEDELAWIRQFDIILLNAVIDVMYNGPGILKRILTHVGRYVIIHRQEISETRRSQSLINNSYNSKTYHSIINRENFNSLIEEMQFDIIKEVKLNFGNWENGGSSFLLLNRNWVNPKYDQAPLRQLANRIQSYEQTEHGMLDVVIGAGSGRHHPNWICTNQEELDIEVEKDWQFLFSDRKVNTLFAEHVWEHLRNPLLATQLAFKYLSRNDGRLRIAVPDGFHPNKDYIEHVRPGGIGPGADDHQTLWNYKTLTQLLKDAGFQQIVLNEYWDEQGQFHYSYMNKSYGWVTRSFHNDERNQDGLPNYTSLIIDAIKRQ